MAVYFTEGIVFSKYFARILKRQENDRSLNSKKKNSDSVGEPPYHVQNDIYIT